MSQLPWRRKPAWIVWLLFLLLWTLLLCLPIPRRAELAAGDMEPTRKEVIAKLIHLFGYTLFTVLSGWLRVPCRWRHLLMFLIMAHAAVTELIQGQIPGRSGRLTDVGIDHAGVLLGLLLSWKWWAAKDEPAPPGESTVSG